MPKRCTVLNSRACWLGLIWAGSILAVLAEFTRHTLSLQATCLVGPGKICRSQIWTDSRTHWKNKEETEKLQSGQRTLGQSTKPRGMTRTTGIVPSHKGRERGGAGQKSSAGFSLGLAWLSPAQPSPLPCLWGSRWLLASGHGAWNVHGAEGKSCAPERRLAFMVCAP